MIAERFPDHDVLGEEFGSGESGNRIPHFCWVFDPIDGTTNYAHGLPIFCSSLAFEVDGEPLVAAIYDPNRRELFTAERGQGAWLNGAPLRVSAADTLIDSLLVTGFHYDVQKDPGSVMDFFAAFISRARAVRRLGSAALDLAYVAAGRFDGFWERRLQPWDVAAGALIVAEAGGQVTAMSGGKYGSREGSVLASNGLIHTQMLETIADRSDPPRCLPVTPKNDSCPPSRLRSAFGGASARQAGVLLGSFGEASPPGVSELGPPALWGLR